MNILIGVAIYIAGVFAAREADRRVCIKEDDRDPMIWMWFISWFAFVGIAIYYQTEYHPIKLKGNWFTGKYWKDEK
jgi:hypothetical protein